MRSAGHGWSGALTSTARPRTRRLPCGTRWLAAVGPPGDTETALARVERDTITAATGGAELRTQDLMELVPELATRITVGSGRWAAEVPLVFRLSVLLALRTRDEKLVVGRIGCAGS